MNRNCSCASLGLVVLLASSTAGAAWTNQMGNGDSNTNFLGVGAGSGQVASATGFVNTGSSPQSLYAATSNGDMWSEGGFTGYGAAITYADESVAYMGGLIGKVWKTDNGGMSWTELPEATVGGGTLLDGELVADILISSDSQTVLIVGASGLLSLSTDGGATWVKDEVALPGEDSSISGGAILGESIWLVGGTPSQEPTEGDEFDDPTPGAPASSGFVIKSEDGGGSFSTVASNLEYYLGGVSFVNPAEGWVAGSTAEEGGAAVGKTSDGGETWDFTGVPDLPESEVFGVRMGASTVPAGCTEVKFFGREVGVLMCTTATYELDGATALFLSDDGGDSWEIQAGYKDAMPNVMLAASPIVDMAMPDCKRGWLVGGGKVIQRWDNDDQSMDCESGGGPSEEVPDDIEDPDGESGGGGSGCGCTMNAPEERGLLGIITSIF